MAQSPSINDRDHDLLKKITENTYEGITNVTLPTGAATAAKQDTLAALISPSGRIFTSAGAQTITAGGAAQTVFAANTSRVYLFIVNTSDTIMYLDVTGAAATTASIPLAASGGFYEPLVAPSALISILCATTGKAFVAKQAS
jgi:hypothetical protein